MLLVLKYIFFAVRNIVVNFKLFSKGSFGSHHLRLELKNSFIILSITCLSATELIIEFIWNSMIFHLMPNLNTY
jgi:hypothetical protein